MRTSHALSPDLAESAAPPAARPAVERSGPKPRPIDLVHLTRQTFGDKRLETELLRLFVRQADQIAEVLAADGAASPDRQSARDLLHMLVGSARAVGAVQVSALAERLELDRRSGTSPDALSPTDRAPLIEAIASAKAYIGDLLEAA